MPQLQEKVRQFEVEMGHDRFWDNPEIAQTVVRKLNATKNKLAEFQKCQSQFGDLEVYAELLAEQPDDLALATEAESAFHEWRLGFDSLEMQSLMSGEFDNDDCTLTINAGAGGTDAQDWAEMLMRMYIRWIEAHRFAHEVVDVMPGDEAGIKSTTILVKGDKAYGFLKNEIGIHRLVRISPFNANDKRQTSFAGVDVLPEIEDNTGTIEINPAEIRVDTFRASGAGGQHINKTDSAVRITHIPTGIVVQSQNSRSQGANKDTAMKLLKSRLILLQKEQFKDQLNAMRSNSQIAWGNQIRSYVLHPYSMVKDHRTNYETSDVQGVLDGELDPFIQSVLHNSNKAGNENGI